MAKVYKLSEFKKQKAGRQHQTTWKNPENNKELLNLEKLNESNAAYYWDLLSKDRRKE
ncbi:MAG: hypothetical protein H0Z39_00755 [Peptococcaceae bacterium]|nr:hypothetical protein [Peptococcaceae bacterium]